MPCGVFHHLFSHSTLPSHIGLCTALHEPSQALYVLIKIVRHWKTAIHSATVSHTQPRWILNADASFSPHIPLTLV